MFDYVAEHPDQNAILHAHEVQCFMRRIYNQFCFSFQIFHFVRCMSQLCLTVLWYNDMRCVAVV